MLRQVSLVLLPVPFQENELADLHTPPDERNTSQGFLEDNVDAPMHSSSVCYPPQIQPIRINLAASVFALKIELNSVPDG